MALIVGVMSKRDPINCPLDQSSINDSVCRSLASPCIAVDSRF